MKQFMGHEEQEQEDGNYTDPEMASSLIPMTPMPRLRTLWTKRSAGRSSTARQAGSRTSTRRSLTWPPTRPSTTKTRILIRALSPARPLASDRVRTQPQDPHDRLLEEGAALDVPHLHRIGQDDFRIFGRKDIPAKRDWLVLSAWMILEAPTQTVRPRSSGKWLFASAKC